MNIEYRMSNIECRNLSDDSQDSKLVGRHSTLIVVLLCFCILMHFTGGCENAGPPRVVLAKQIDKLRQDKTQLQQQIEQAGAENEKLRERLQILSGLPAEVKGENLYRLQSIKISRYTNFYDKDKDGKKEKLIVYIQPIDEEGDIVKATGTVDVQLWDLNKEAGEALLGQWQVKPEELKKLWFATLVIINYRLTFDVAEIIDKFEEPLTVKVTFTDYLTGKVFKEQRVIKPQSS